MTRRFTLAVVAAAALATLPVSCARPQPRVTPSAPPAASAPAPKPQPPQPPPAAIPQRLSDAEFWRLVNDLSEPNGYFRSDNLLSNEIWLQSVIPELTHTVRPGQAYLGVGPEQNFTYISALKPAMVFIVDVRRGNLDLHLLYKALFELSADRADFAARLFSRPRPDVPATASARDIFTALSAVPPDEGLFTENLRAIEDHLTKTHGFALTPEDFEGIEYVYRAFSQYGPGLTYWMSGGRFGRNAPTYADLMEATDETGVARGYLASDENFAVVRELEVRNLLVPLVGNFAGPKALRQVGAYLKAHNAVVAAFYLSNVEQYLNMDGLWMDFCGNVRTLPLDDTSTFIRSVRNGQYGYGVGLTNVLGKMVAETAVCAGT